MVAAIDYMDRRLIFTLDPDYFPLNRMREIVDYLHKNNQHFSTCIPFTVFLMSRSMPTFCSCYDRPCSRRHAQ